MSLLPHANDQSLPNAMVACELADVEQAGQVPQPLEIGIEDLLGEAGAEGPVASA